MSTSRGKRAVLESSVEDYLVEQVEKYSGIADKFCTPGRRGPPDRLVTWPRWTAGVSGPTHCKMELVEVKTVDERGNPTSLDPPQEQDHKRRRAAGCIVRVIWTHRQVDEYIRYERSRRGEKLEALLVGCKESPLYQGHTLVKVPRKRVKLAPPPTDEFG
jgi:hypothetical protein